MRQQPVISIISVIGTSLAIFLIMVVVMLKQVTVAPFAPESNRDRFLHATFGSIENPDKNWSSNGGMSYKSAKKLYGDLESAEATTIYTCFPTIASLNVKGGAPVKIDYLGTDANFWKVFDFTFIDGKPYDEATVESGLPQVVISRSVARKLFGTTDVAGREMMFNHVPFTVAGVVEDVSSLANKAWGDAWVPYKSSSETSGTWNFELMGSMGVTILAKDRKDFDAIREECDRRMAQYNKEVAETEWQFVSRNRPYDQEKSAIAFSSNNEPDLEGERRTNLMVYIILLIVPAVNLSSMTESRLRRRVSEIGVRRAFGASRGTIMRQIIMENLSVTLVAGLLGLALSVVFAYLADSMLFAAPFSLSDVKPKADLSMLLQWSTFLWALLFCFVLNLLSTGIPAWRASRTSVVGAISGRQH